MRRICFFLLLSLAAFAQNPAIVNLVNAGSGAPGPIAPGQQVNIMGTGLGDATVLTCGGTTGPIPTVCGGVSVLLNGKAVPIRSESAQVVAFYVPADTTGTGATVQVTRQTGGQTLSSNVFNANITAVAPGIFTTQINGVLVGNFQNAAGIVITPANPARPGDVVRALGTGFGVTNPASTPGTVIPQSPPVNIVAPVRVTIAGQNATVTSAVRVPGGFGATDQILFQIPEGIPGGSQPITINAGGVNAQPLQLAIAFSGPTVSALVNSASNATTGLPNAGVAPGSIVVAYGARMGPDALVTAPGYPWPENLSGTSAQITVNGTTTRLRLYYTSANQIAGLLPSNTPPGNGTITITYNGQTGGPTPINVLASNFGVYSVNQAGYGPAIVTFADYSLVSKSNAANPGDTLIIWGTGLGAVTGDEGNVPLPGDMTNLPVQVFVGGLPATVVYRGRSGCCIGEDQIAFVVPEVKGCNVPLAVQIRNNVSNHTLLSVATTGRTCTPAVPLVPDTVSAIPQPKVLFADINRNVYPAPQSPTDPASSDTIEVNPFQLAISGAAVNANSDGLPPGSCLVTHGEEITGDPPVLRPLDAGPSLTLRGPSAASRTINKSGAQYTAQLGNTSPGNFLDSGDFTLSGTGGADIGPFTGAFKVSNVTWTDRPTGPINRFQGVTVSWTGADPNGIVQISGGTPRANFTCFARGSDGKFTVPPNTLLAIPPGGGGLTITHAPAIQLFQATGVDIAAVQLHLSQTALANFQ